MPRTRSSARPAIYHVRCLIAWALGGLLGPRALPRPRAWRTRRVDVSALGA